MLEKDKINRNPIYEYKFSILLWHNPLHSHLACDRYAVQISLEGLFPVYCLRLYS